MADSHRNPEIVKTPVVQHQQQTAPTAHPVIITYVQRPHCENQIVTHHDQSIFKFQVRNDQAIFKFRVRNDQYFWTPPQAMYNLILISRSTLSALLPTQVTQCLQGCKANYPSPS